MTFLTSKWMVAAMVLVAILVILFLTGRKSVHSEITIEASPQQVWEVLTDIPAHQDWNQVLLPMGGAYLEGNTITYQFFEPGKDAVEMSGKVVTIKANELLNQRGGMPGVLTFDHRYILESAGGDTKVTIHEDYRGIVVNFWSPSSVQVAYDQLIKALKKRVEANQQNE